MRYAAQMYINCSLREISAITVLEFPLHQSILCAQSPLQRIQYTEHERGGYRTNGAAGIYIGKKMGCQVHTGIEHLQGQAKKDKAPTPVARRQQQRQEAEKAERPLAVPRWKAVIACQFRPQALLKMYPVCMAVKFQRPGVIQEVLHGLLYQQGCNVAGYGGNKEPPVPVLLYHQHQPQQYGYDHLWLAHIGGAIHKVVAKRSVVRIEEGEQLTLIEIHHQHRTSYYPG